MSIHKSKCYHYQNTKTSHDRVLCIDVHVLIPATKDGALTIVARTSRRNLGLYLSLLYNSE